MTDRPCCDDCDNIVMMIQTVGAGVYPVPEEGAIDAWAPTSAPISSNEPTGAGGQIFNAATCLTPTSIRQDMDCNIGLCYGLQGTAHAQGSVMIQWH